MKNIKYEREKVLKYAKRWAYDRNPQFYNFDNVGGDCTSFVSQCILAGSNVMNYILLHILLIHIIKRYQSMDYEK
ncbi:MAG: amidase domain-containing protein [Clostridia bacterium]